MANKKDIEQQHSPTVENRRARFDYHIGETFEVGLVLRGSEIKAVRQSLISLGEGYVQAKESPVQLVLLNVNIGEYSPAAEMGHKPTRPRPLLAHKREIVKMARAVDTKGMTIVPLKLYFKNGFAKLLIGLAKGKASHDKRQSISEREAKRDIDRAMSRRR